MSSEDIARRRAAKPFNERVKLIAAFLNNAGIAILVGALVIPYLGGSLRLDTLHPLWLLVPAGLHLAGQVALTFLKSED